MAATAEETAAAAEATTRLSPHARKLDDDDSRELYEWLSSLSAQGEIKVELFRKDPPTWKGVKTSGLLETFDAPISHEHVANTHGGGRYQIKVQRRGLNKRGNPIWEYSTARTFEVAGHPNLEPLMRPIPKELEEQQQQAAQAAASRVSAAEASAQPVAQAMAMAQQLMRDSQEEARYLREQQGRPASGSDEAMRMLVDKLGDQVADLQRALLAKDERLLAAMTQKPDTSMHDRLFDVLDHSTKDHSSRINEIRIAHDAEMRAIREGHRDELRAKEDRIQREIDSVRAGHQREVESIKEAHRSAMDALKLSYQTRIDGLEDQIRRLDRELTEAKTEMAQLRSRKEQGPLEQVEGLVKLRNGLEALTGKDEGDEDDGKGKSTAERVIHALMNSSVAQGVAERISRAAAPPQEPMVAVRRKDGQVAYVPQSYIAAAQMQAQQRAEEEAAAGPRIDPEAMQRAVLLLETAYRNGQAPATVAISARGMVPGDILGYLQREGVDTFLNEAVPDQSPLCSVAGRQWVRQIAAALFGQEPAAHTPDDLESEEFSGDVDSEEGAAVE
jgi:hypothetical protein